MVKFKKLSITPEMEQKIVWIVLHSHVNYRIGIEV